MDAGWRPAGNLIAMSRKAISVHTEIDKSQLALAVARNQVGEKLPIKDILLAEGVSEDKFEHYLNDPLFTAEVKRLAKELTENGFSFQAKCRVLAEDLLRDKYAIIKDPDTPAAVRMKGIESLVKWGDLEPRPAALQPGQQQPTFAINIVIPPAARAQAIAEVKAKPEAAVIEGEYETTPAEETDEQ